MLPYMYVLYIAMGVSEVGTEEQTWGVTSILGGVKFICHPSHYQNDSGQLKTQNKNIKYLKC